MFLVLNKYEWLATGWFTEEELEAADERGLIATKNGTDCYITKHIPSSLPRALLADT